MVEHIIEHGGTEVHHAVHCKYRIHESDLSVSESKFNSNELPQTEMPTV